MKAVIYRSRLQDCREKSNVCVLIFSVYFGRVEDCSSERQERHFSQFEVLFCEWQSHDSDGEQHAEKEMRESCDQSAGEQPDDVEQRGDASALAGAGLLSERKKRQQSKLEKLKPERNADDGAAQRKSAHKILKRSGEPAENNPYYIS